MIERRAFLATAAGVSATAGLGLAAHAGTRPRIPTAEDDRHYMVDLLSRMASPVLGAMARDRLQASFSPELSPTWDGRNPKVAYLECFGRLMAGIAPWLALPGDGTPEGKLRQRLRDEALASYANAVDPARQDYLHWRGEGQALVDSAYFSNALLRAPQTLWHPLDATTKSRIVTELQGLRSVSPPYTNWLLFAAMNEAFLLFAGEQWDPERIDLAVRKINEWYVGDGWYGDGPRFHFDYYGAYVIHPMLVEILEVLVATDAKFNSLPASELLEQAYRRMERFAECLERMIGPDGCYPPIGRSLTYRTAVFQPLGLLALRKRLPKALPEGQARAATMAAQRAIFSHVDNFDSRGFLTLGFAGHQPGLADTYSNAGSMYLASLSLLSLGLPAQDSYWTTLPLEWTMKRAYSGQAFSKDHFVDF